MWKNTFEFRYRLALDEKTINWFKTKEEGLKAMELKDYVSHKTQYLDYEVMPNIFKTVAVKEGYNKVKEL